MIFWINHIQRRSLLGQFLVGALTSLVACARDDKKDDASTSSEAASIPPTSQASSPTTAKNSGSSSTSQTSDGYNYELARLTPEQIKSTLKAALQVELSDGTFDYLLGYFAVPLGGLLPVAGVRLREPRPRPQTLLAARAVAWHAALKVIDREYNQVEARTVFTDSALAWDLSDEAPAYHLQVDTLYKLLLARLPSTDEQAEVARTFRLAKAQTNGNVVAAWLVVLYGLLSTMEFWHVWR